MGRARWKAIALALTLAGGIARAAVTVTRDGDRTTYDVRIEGVDFKPDNDGKQKFVTATLRGIDGYEGVIYDETRPEIPVVRFYVDGEAEIELAPPQASTRKPIALPAPLSPSHPLLARHRDAVLPPYVVDEAAYRADRLMPGRELDIAEVGTVRGRRRRLVTLHPFQYNPAQAQAVVTDRLRVVVRHKPTPKPAPFAVGETIAIVVSAKLAESPSLKRLAAFKERLGYLTRFIVLGRDAKDPDSIRDALKKLYADAAHPLRLVLLVGDATGVPGFKTPRLPTGITDHYYRALDGASYESDIGAPDVALGRLSAASEEQLAAIVAKHLRYETGDFADTSWLTRSSMIATDDPLPEHWKMAETTLDWAIARFLAPAGYASDRLFAISNKATGADVLKALRAGRGHVGYSGHGEFDRWEGPQMLSEDVAKLDHPDALPFVSSQACNTAELPRDSFAEAWQRHPHGSIFFWGSMDALHWDTGDDLLGRRLYELLFGERKLGFDAITDGAIEVFWRYYGGAGMSKYYWETFVNLGDPSMRHRTKAPIPVSLQVPSEIAAGATSFRARVSDAKGAAIAGARVGALVDGTEYRAAATTDERGEAVLPLPAELRRGAAVVVTATGDDLRLASGTAVRR